MAKPKLIDRVLFFLATKWGWRFILFWGKFTRIEYMGREHLQWLQKNRKPFLLCVWHGRMLLPVLLHRNQNLHAMVSEHHDGEMIARTLEKLGYRTIRGSSTRGARKASIRMIRSLREGKSGAIIPDGPNGPRHEFKLGAVVFAQKSGAYLLLSTFASSRFIQFQSWDRFYLWKPFSKSIALYSEPIFVPEDLEPEALEAFRRRVEQLMVEQEKTADEFFRK